MVKCPNCGSLMYSYSNRCKCDGCGALFIDWDQIEDDDHPIFIKYRKNDKTFYTKCHPGHLTFKPPYSMLPIPYSDDIAQIELDPVSMITLDCVVDSGLMIDDSAKVSAASRFLNKFWPVSIKEEKE